MTSSLLRRVAPLVISIVCVTVNTLACGADEPWQTDWKEFIKVFTGHEFDAKFIDKKVEWSGTITQLYSPKEGDATSKGGIRFAMDPEIYEKKFKVGEVTGVFSPLQINLTHKEWSQWSALKPGQRIRFRTKLWSLVAETGVVFAFEFRGNWFGMILTSEAEFIKIENAKPPEKDK